MSKTWNFEAARALPRLPDSPCPYCGSKENLMIVPYMRDNDEKLFLRTIFCFPCGYRPNSTTEITDEGAILAWDSKRKKRRKAESEKAG